MRCSHLGGHSPEYCPTSLAIIIISLGGQHATCVSCSSVDSCKSAPHAFCDEVWLTTMRRQSFAAPSPRMGSGYSAAAVTTRQVPVSIAMRQVCIYICIYIIWYCIIYIYISYVIYSLVVPRSLYHEVKMKVLQTQQEQQIGTEP